jgi:hypothetical protein
MEKKYTSKKGLVGCQNCENKFLFELPQPLINACLEGKLVIFAGAGISTENKAAFPFSFYDDIKMELDAKGDNSFPVLMSQFVKKHRISVSCFSELSSGLIMQNHFRIFMVK